MWEYMYKGEGEKKNHTKCRQSETAAAAVVINFSKIRNWFCADSSESFRKLELKQEKKRNDEFGRCEENKNEILPWNKHLHAFSHCC